MFLFGLVAVGLGLSALAIVFVMKSGEKEPQVSVERMRYPIKRLERPTIATGAGEKRVEEKKIRVPEVKAKEPEIKAQEPTITAEQPETKMEEPQISPVDKPTSQATPKVEVPTRGYSVNVASFRKKVRAERLMNELHRKGYTASVVEVAIPGKGTWYRVSLGRFPSQKEAQAAARAFQEKEGMECFVTLTE